MSFRYRSTNMIEPVGSADERGDGHPHRSTRRASATLAAAMLCVGGAQVLASSSAIALPPTNCTPTTGFTNCELFVGTNSDQTFTVPAGVTSIRADLEGSGGGAGNFDPATYSGNGGATSGTVAVTPGQQLTVMVGTTFNPGGIGTSTYGGGGSAGPGERGFGGNGGGLSALWVGTPYMSDPLLIAGGGGGQSAAGQSNQNGGAGGGLTGGDGTAEDGELTGGAGGTQSTAGAAGADGTAGSGYFGGAGGGSDGADGGGGGGGGWRGGGGGGSQDNPDANNNDGGGGGGSGYIGGAGVTDATTTAGAGAAPNTDGQVLVQWSTGTVPPTTPHATVRAPHSAVHRSVIPTTCSLGAANVGSCVVVAYARVGGHLVVVGRGKAVRRSGQSSAALPVTVVLNREGKKLADRPGGTHLRLRAEVRQTGTKAVHKASTTARVIASRVALKSIDFAFNSATIRAADVTYLKHVRHEMGPVASISCVGHTDYAGNSAHEKKLSLRRAKAVCSLLTHGRASVHTHAKGDGGAHPVTKTGTATSRKANRYASVTLKY